MSTFSITATDLSSMVYDPARIQSTIYSALNNSADLTISSATNPFVMLLEAATVTSSNSALESRAVIREKHASLAASVYELYQHLTDAELENMFAVPSVGVFQMYVNLNYLMQFGYQPDTGEYRETIIPIGTVINVLNTPFTILNDIVVRYYTNGTVFVEQVSNDNDFALNGVGVIDATIINTFSNNDTIAWIMFKLGVKQVRKTTKITTVTASTGFTVSMDLTDSYCYADIAYKNALTNDSYAPVAKSMNQDYIDPSTPTAYLSLTDSTVVVKLPDVYLVEGTISGNVLIDIYETVGAMYLPINKYDTTNFSITLGDTTSSVSASTSTNIIISALGNQVVDGGKNAMTLAELKASVIYSVTGSNKLPISTKQLEALGSYDGYYIYKATDILTDRLYIAVKNTPSIETSDLIYARQDVFINTINLTLSEVSTYSNITISDAYFVIKAGSIFKVNNGVVTMLTPDELTDLSAMTNVDKMSYLLTNKLYYTPYYYVINTLDGYSVSRVYNLDTPSISNYRIIGKNTGVIQNVNTNKYTIEKTSSGYRVHITLLGNSDYDTLDKNYVKAQLAIPLYGNSVNVYFDGTYDATNARFIFDIESDLFVDEDGYIDVENGNSSLLSKSININTSANIYIYTTDGGVIDETGYLKDEIYATSGLTSYTVLTKESISISFGVQLDNLWNRVYNTYSDRKYKTYDYNIPSFYTEDVYEIFSNGTTIDIRYDEDTKTYYEYRNILHHKGDAVTDSDGNTVYLHMKGDFILDPDTGLPIIDTNAGLIRYIDILMLEYEFMLADYSPYVNYRSDVLSSLYGFIYTDMTNINNMLLDNTKLYYKSPKSSKSVTIAINGMNSYIDYLVTPTVELYIQNTSTLSSTDITAYENKIGAIIDAYLDESVINTTTLEASIVAKLGGNVVGAKISGLAPGDPRIITTDKRCNKLVMNKRLDFNKNNELIVRYNLTLDVRYI